VVWLVTEGMSNPGIADRLFISRATVKTHLAHIFTKLDVINRSQLTALPPGQPPKTSPAAAEPRTQPAGRAPRGGGCRRTRAAWGTEQQARRGSRGHRACRHMGGYRMT
jgi:hypothetical protein